MRLRGRAWRAAAALVLIAMSTVYAPFVVAQDVVTHLTQPTLPLPPMRAVEEMAQRTVGLHAENGGSTVNLYFGDLAGQPLYVVTLYPEVVVRVEGARLDPARVRQFIGANLG